MGKYHRRRKEISVETRGWVLGGTQDLGSQNARSEHRHKDRAQTQRQNPDTKTEPRHISESSTGGGGRREEGHTRDEGGVSDPVGTSD